MILIANVFCLSFAFLFCAFGWPKNIMLIRSSSININSTRSRSQSVGVHELR